MFLEQINAYEGRNNWIELLFHEFSIIVNSERWYTSYSLWKPWLLPRQKCAARKLERRQGLPPFLLVQPKGCFAYFLNFCGGILQTASHTAHKHPSNYHALLQKAQTIHTYININHTAVIKATAFSAAEHSHSFIQPFVCSITAEYPAQMKSNHYPGLQYLCTTDKK